MQAVISLKPSELSEEFLNKLKSIFAKSDDCTITISISNDKKKAYFEKLDNAISEIKEGKYETFTLETFENFIKS